MKYEDACKRAAAVSLKSGRMIWVVWEPPEFEDMDRDTCWEYGDEFALNNWFAGCTPRAAFEDGRQVA